jgi:hypothetical protein
VPEYEQWRLVAAFLLGTCATITAFIWFDKVEEEEQAAPPRP